VSANEARKIAKGSLCILLPARDVLPHAVLAGDRAEVRSGFRQVATFGAPSPKDTDIVTPNNVSPYSYAWLDLRAEPWLLTIPSQTGTQGR